MPDLIFVARARAGVVTEDNIQGSPDLVVEVLSPSTRKRDEGLKRQRYEVLGVGEYWLVDPVKQRVRVYRREGSGFGVASAFSTTEQLSSPRLPGFAIPVAEIFRGFD